MANLMKFEKLHRLTLTTKGKAIAKHPALRNGVVEVVKANVFEESQEVESGSEEKDWYAHFDAFIDSSTLPQGVESWEEAFALADTVEVEKAKQRKNYPDSNGPFAGPHNSFPINSQAHVYAAAKLIGHAANPAQVKANIIRIAHSKGYSLPKSWQTKKVSSLELSPEQTERLKALLGEETEKARPPANTVHGHDHGHLSAHGYSYSHNHDHEHTPDHMAAHDSSETAHAHAHMGMVQKAMDQDELTAELGGLKSDIEKIATAQQTLAETVKTAVEKLAEKESALTQATADLEAAKTAHEELVQKVSAMETSDARKPLTAAPPHEGKPQITSNMKFDDAFNAIMHGA